MITRAAVLDEIGCERPYAETRPLTIEESGLNGALDALAAGEVVRQIVAP